MSNLALYPYVATEDGWSISDSVMAAIWLQLEQEGKVEHLFYDGSIRDLQGWLEFIKRPGLFALVVADIDKKMPVHIAWLKDVWDGVAWAHHASLGHDRKYIHKGWALVLDYWSQFPLRILLGLTPETNIKAVKFLKKICGFTPVGTIPEVCNMAYEGKRVGGVISYLLLEKQEDVQLAEKLTAIG